MILNKPVIRVFCVDDHALLLEGLRARLATAGDIEIVGRLHTAENLVPCCKQTLPNIVLMDIEMPGPDPFEAVEDLRRQCPGVPVIMLSAYVRDHYIDTAVNAGVWGYLSKHDEPERILAAIRDVAHGAFVFGPSVLERLTPAFKHAPNGQTQPPASKVQTLTAREQEVLRLIGRGLTRAQIANTMCRSPKTVDAHRASIMEKVDIHDRTELALFAVREGLVEV